MSDTDKGRGVPERPMLVLGEDLPDVEDTTPEELRRQQEEARREIEAARRQAQEEIDRRRREAEREIAELEKQKERELKEREKELERTQRKLYQRETNLLRRLPKTGKQPRRLVTPPPKPPLTQTGLRRSPTAVLLGAGAALAIVVGALSGGTASDSELRDQVAATAEARVLWLQSGLEADAAIAQRMAGQEVSPGPDGTYDNVRLAQEAARLAPDSARYAERAAEGTERMLDPATATVRALTLWGGVHDESGYAVGGWDVEDLVEEADGPGGWTYLLMGSAVLALGLLLLHALSARAWVSLALVVAAGGLALTSTLVVAGGGSRVAQAVADHDAADEVLDDVHSQVGRDLQVAYGTSPSSLADDENYWTRSPFWREEGTATFDDYLSARTALGEAQADGDEAVADAALALVEAGRGTFEANVPAVEQTRAAVVDSLAGSRSAWVTSLLTALVSAVLAVLALALSGGREEAR